MTSRPVVLICAPDPMIAGLLGMLAELAQLQPRFPAPGERADEALARVKPVLAVLLDDSLDEARSELFIARAARRQVAVALFGAPTRRRESPPRGEAIPWFEVPRDATAFRRMVDTAVSAEWWRRTGDRRAAASAPQGDASGEEFGEDTVIYRGSDGRRWRVYDRRGSERRRERELGSTTDSAALAAGERSVRVFVNDSGEAWECALTGSESGDRSASALEQQLARARRV